MLQLRSSRRAAIAGACSALALAALPSAAAAQSGLEAVPCQGPPGTSKRLDAKVPAGSACASVTVPLDHSGGVPGTIRLATTIVPATRSPATGTLVVLTGGPGQPAVPLAGALSAQLEGARRTHDLVFVDQRGTGSSGAVKCPDTIGATAVRKCAEALGKRRPFYTTRETALDVEDVRAALKVEKLALYGVSYGAKVAGEYARRFPARTAALVLDSPQSVDVADVVFRLPQLSLPRVLREVCFSKRCRAVLVDPAKALATLARQLERKPLRGRAVLASGRTKPARVTVDEVYALVLASDTDPFLRADLPAAIASGVLGDAAPLLRLLRTPVARTPKAEAVNTARFLATTCVEGGLPWSPESPIAGRAQALERFAESTPRSAFGPFGPATVIRNSTATQCLAWPSTPMPDGVASQGPDVPALVIAGREDLRTPLEDARRTASQYPHGQVLAVPGVGHSVLGSDPTSCTATAIAAFLAGRPVAKCSRAARRLIPRAPFLPASLGDLEPADGLPKAVGRIATAAQVSLGELTRLAVTGATGTASGLRFTGLRGGTATASSRGITLRAFEVIRGVRITGFAGKKAGRLVLPAPGGIVGVLVTGRGNTIRATVGGERFTFKVG